MGIIPKLWFIPGIAGALSLALQNGQVDFVGMVRLGVMNRMVLLAVILPAFLHIAATFLLGRWIVCLYSVEPAPKKSPKVHSNASPYNSAPVMAAAVPTQGFCGACGAQAMPGNAFCPACGSKLASHMATPAPNGNTVYNATGYAHDAPSTGFTVLGGFIPAAGLILYLVWRESLPLRAKSAGKGAIIGIITYVALIIVIYAIYFAFLMSLFS